MNADDTIVVYERLLVLSEQMLIAATQREWHDFEALDVSYTQQIDVLMASSKLQSLSPEANIIAERLLTDIITSNAKLFDITKLWQEELALMINSVDTEQKLQQAYNNKNTY